VVTTPMPPLRHAQLLWHTARYLRLSQIAARLRLRSLATVRRMAPSVAQHRYERLAERSGLRPPSVLWGRHPIDARVRSLSSEEDWTRSRRRAEAARSGRFTFLSEAVDLGQPIAWEAPGQSQLWRYQLHYGAYLLDLLASRPDAWHEVEAVMSEWISACRLGEAHDPWHPFVVSERVVNWLFAIQIGAPSAEAVSENVWRSLAQQTTFIERNLEEDVGGNHLLKNLKAMSIASCVWEGATADSWRDRYVTAFDRELARQLLTDGAHYERSPMYHSLVLADAIEVVFALRLGGYAVPRSLADSVRAMVAYLPTITHPDGEIALFNDSVHGEAPPAPNLQAAANTALGEPPDVPLSVRHALLGAAVTTPCRSCATSVERAATEDGGIARVPVLGGRGLLLVDVGRACPDDLPAHAHADFFSFELSVDKRRLVVDSGVGEYAAGSWREYYRSTRAHNTVSIDDVDQIECWGSFRVARRARVLDRVAIKGPHLAGVEAWHDGYTRLAEPVQVGRALVALGDRGWLVLDNIKGTGAHTWESYLHAAPDAEVTLAGPDHALLTADERRLTIAWFGVNNAHTVRGQMSPRQGWYAPEFGRHLPTWVLTMHGHSTGPARFGYVLAPNLEPDEVSIAESHGDIEVQLGAARYCVRGSGATMVASLEATS